MATPYEMERLARIASNQLYIAYLVDLNDYPFLVAVHKAPRRARKAKDTSFPRVSVPRVAKAEAQGAIAAMAKVENSSCHTRQEQRSQMADPFSKPGINTAKYFLASYAGYSEADAENPNALPER